MNAAIQAVIGEFKTLSPDISKTAVFRLNGAVLAASKDTTPEQTQALIACLNGIKHAGCIGGLKNYVIQDVNSQLSITQVDDAYFVALHSRSEDQKIISLIKVIAPAVIRLALGVEMPSADKELEPTAAPKEPTVKAEQPAVKNPAVQEVAAPQSIPEPLVPKVPSSQFMVERIGGFLVASDVVRIDGDVVVGWQAQFEGKPIARVVVETLESKSVICKFKIQSGSRGVIGVPDKLLKSLGCSKGALVMVKPLIE